MTSCYQKLRICLEIHSNSFRNAGCLFQGFLGQKAGKPSPGKRAFAALPALADKTSSLLYPKVYILTRAHRRAEPSGCHGALAEAVRQTPNAWRGPVP